MRYVVLLLVLVLAGCTPTFDLVCKGKGSISFQGGPYAGGVIGDCGDGFEYHRASPGANPGK